MMPPGDGKVMGGGDDSSGLIMRLALFGHFLKPTTIIALKRVGVYECPTRSDYARKISSKYGKKKGSTQVVRRVVSVKEWSKARAGSYAIRLGILLRLTLILEYW